MSFFNTYHALIWSVGIQGIKGNGRDCIFTNWPTSEKRQPETAAMVLVTALRDDQNTIIGYLLIGTDNTTRKQIETEQQKLNQALRDQQFYTRSLIESNIEK